MSIIQWQYRLLPIVLIAFFLLSVFFIIYFFKQADRVQERYSVSAKEELLFKYHDVVFKDTGRQTLEWLKWRSRDNLERVSIMSRYQQARLILEGRLQVIFFSFGLGAIMVLIGSLFILSKISEKTSELKLVKEDFNLSLLSSSPGIILSFLGTIMIVFCLFQKTEVKVSDSPQYVPYAADSTTRDQNSEVLPDSAKEPMMQPQRLDKSDNEEFDKLIKPKK